MTKKRELQESLDWWQEAHANVVKDRNAKDELLRQSMRQNTMWQAENLKLRSQVDSQTTVIGNLRSQIHDLELAAARAKARASPVIAEGELLQRGVDAALSAWDKPTKKPANWSAKKRRTKR